MAINFPNSPIAGEYFVTGNLTYQYTGTVWVSVNTKTNNAFNQANTAFDKANSANVIASAAFDKANGAAQLSFSTIVANGTSLVADSNADTLTVRTTGNIAITADATGDNITFDLTTTGVTAATYGSTTIVPVLNVDSRGRLTTVANATIDTSIATAAFAKANAQANLAFSTVVANGTSLIADSNADTLTILTTGNVSIIGNATGDNMTFDLTTTGVIASTYGNASIIPVLTVDSRGRLTSVSNVAVVSSTPSNSIVYVSDSPPSGIANGTLWWNSNDGSLYIYYGDGTSRQWVITSGGLLETSNVGAIAVGAFSQANIAYSSAVLKTGNTMTGNLVMSGANISFVTATNSGIYWTGTGSSFIHSPVANTLVFGTAFSEDMRIDSSGNVSVSSKLGIGISSPRSKFDIIGTSAGQITTLTDGATITPDFASNNSFTVTLGGNRTLANATNTTVGQSGIIYVVQDVTGSRTLSFGLAYKFVDNIAPTLTTTANAVDAIIYSVRTANSYVCQTILNVGNRNDN